MSKGAYKIISFILWCILFLPKLGKVVFVNNFFLSTNLYPKDFWKRNLSKIIHHPLYPLAIRSIMDTRDFEQRGFVRIVARHVNIMDYTKIQKKKQKKLRVDITRLKSLLDAGYTLESYHAQPSLPHIEKTELSETMLERFKFCYDSLYVNKYSKYNPHFTLAWLRLFISYPGTGLIWIKDNNGVILAVIGYYKVDMVLTASLFGYDTAARLPCKNNYSLYSALSTLIYMENVRLKTIGHYSGGCRAYKKERGATAHLEYTMVYYKHLPFHKRISWIYMRYLTLFIEFVYFYLLKNV